MKVVFDLDGTLADVTHRAHYVRGGRSDWDAFFAACVDDRPNWPAIKSLLAHLDAGHDVEIWSARSEVVRRETEEWLGTYRVPHTLLTHMRAAGDNTPDTVLKRFWLYQIHESARPDVIYDDRQRVVDMWREEGITCFQVAADWEKSAAIAPVSPIVLRLMVGPAGSGKSTYAVNFPARWVLSTDDLRDDYCGGDRRDQSRNHDVFSALHRMVRARMDCGLPTVVDATNLRRRDRLALANLAPADTTVEYIVIDRPLIQKLRDAGWRSEVMVKGRPLVEVHHERMRSALQDILAGDGLPQVHVVDERQGVAQVAA